PLSDTGTGDGRYLTRHLLPPTLAARKYGLETTIRDGEGREARAAIELEVVAPGPPSPLLISQVYAAGGNSGAIYSHDWVELFNRGRDKIDLTGWSVQYATATGSSWSRVDLGGELPAGRYFLIRLGGGTSGAAPPAPDQTASINLSSSGGKILLTRSSGSITTGCPVGEARADLVGYGNSADCFEGDAPASAPGATTSLIRWGDGCRETDQNRSDWRTDRPRPRNIATHPVDCAGYLASFGITPGGQYPGSIQIYPAYSSLSISPQSEDTRLTLTNTSPNQSIAVRLFWINGGSGTIADNLTTLTPNQTISLLASDIDPDIAGYLVCVAVDLQSGRPINFNHLVGSQYLKLGSGHSANIGVFSIRAIEADPFLTDQVAAAGELIFDGNHYQRLPSMLAVSHLPSPTTASESLLIVDRLEGSLISGLQTIGDLRGTVYSDLESAHSFAVNSSRRQLRLPINDRTPRVTPRLSAIIPAARAGWMKFARTNVGAIVGAILDRNGNGRALHFLDLAEEAVIEFPLTAPGSS
ncbi:MAG: lamin tail domain-containing protein, partial [Acidobacteria bacterium]|nr:lamin tail domain-containing protein [Acidobacteriota bacterium]